MVKHLKIHIYGKVQNVFFRATAKEVACSLGLTGFVCNRADGSVYSEAEGEEELLEKYVAWCRRGPERAIVQRVEVSEAPLQHFDSFCVR